MSKNVETNWYENIAQGTFHEVLAGSDTEKRMQRDMRQTVDEDGEEFYEPEYRKVTEKQAKASPSRQPGYVKDNTPASPVTVAPNEVPQTPTADTNAGPLVGEPGAEKQAKAEVELGGAPPAGVKPEATAAEQAKGGSGKPKGK